MKNYKTWLTIAFVLSLISMVLGIISKLSPGFAFFDLGPLSYFRFTGICLMYAIALSVAQISLKP